ALRREDGSLVLTGRLAPDARVRFTRSGVLLGQAGRLAIVEKDRPPATLPVDSFGSTPQLDASLDHVYRLHEGRLWRESRLGPGAGRRGPRRPHALLDGPALRLRFLSRFGPAGGLRLRRLRSRPERRREAAAPPRPNRGRRLPLHGRALPVPLDRRGRRSGPQ